MNEKIRRYQILELLLLSQWSSSTKEDDHKKNLQNEMAEIDDVCDTGNQVHFDFLFFRC